MRKFERKLLGMARNGENFVPFEVAGRGRVLD
jgi:hypothetical protein